MRPKLRLFSPFSQPIGVCNQLVARKHGRLGESLCGRDREFHLVLVVISGNFKNRYVVDVTFSASQFGRYSTNFQTPQKHAVCLENVVHLVSLHGACVLTTTTIRECRPTVTPRSLSVTAGRITAGFPVFSLIPQELKAGRGSAQIPLGLFLGAINDNQEVEMQNKAPKGRRRQHDPRQSDFLALLDGAGTELMPVPAAVIDEPGAQNMSRDIRRLLNDAIRESRMDREQIAEAVSARAGQPITKPMIDCWTGASRPHRFPGELIPAFCAALGNTILLQGLAEAAGCRVVERREARLIRIAQLRVIRGRVDDEETELMAEEMEPFRREARRA